VIETERTDEQDLIRRALAILAGFVRAHPMPFATSVFGSLIMAIGTVYSAVVLGWLADDLILPTFEGTEPGRTRTFVILSVVGIAAARSTGVIIRRYFAGMMLARAQNDMQTALGDHYLDLAPAELRSVSKGQLLAHADSDVEVASEMLNPMPFTLGVIALLVASIVSLATVDWVLTAVAVGMVPLVVTLNRFNATIAKGPAVIEREAIADLSTVASESFDGALVVKTLGREQAELDRFSESALELRNASVRIGVIRALFAAAFDLLPDIGIVLLVSLGAWRVGNGHMTTGDLVHAVALFSLLVFPLRVIGYFFGGMPPSVVAHDRITRALSRPVSPQRGTAPLQTGPLRVDIANVSVHFGEAPAVNDVNATIAPGEVVALVGSTGCGKSTLLSALADMVPLSSGDIIIGGTALESIDRAVMSRRVAVAWQQPFLLDATISENIAFGARPDGSEIAAAAEASRFAEVARQLPEGFDTKIGEGGVRLSGGQRQRLALARAIVRRPGLLLLDDATSAVDPVVEERILEEIRQIGSTMVIVAHRRSTIALSDRVLLMSRGRIIAEGSHEQLMNVPEYAALLEAYDEQRASLTGSGEGP